MIVSNPYGSPMPLGKALSRYADYLVVLAGGGLRRLKDYWEEADLNLQVQVVRETSPSSQNVYLTSTRFVLLVNGKFFAALPQPIPLW